MNLRVRCHLSRIDLGLRTQVIEADPLGLDDLQLGCKLMVVLVKDILTNSATGN